MCSIAKEYRTGFANGSVQQHTVAFDYSKHNHKTFTVAKVPQ